MRVSFVIPCYNSDIYLLETLDFIEQQTVKPFKVLVVDEGSTDNRVEVV